MAWRFLDPRRPRRRRFEHLLARLASERAEYVKRSNAIKQEIGAVYRAARDHGLPAHLLKRYVEERAIKREEEQTLQNFNEDERKAYFEYTAMTRTRP